MKLNSERYTDGPKYNLNQKKIKEKELIKTRFCNSCKKDIEVEFVKKTWWRDTHKFFYKIKETGRMWSFGCCPKCKFKRHLGKPYSHADGRINSKNEKVLKSVKTEIQAVNFLRSLGFSVQTQLKVNGPDIVCSFGDQSYRVEVKPTYERKEGNKSRWYVNAVCKKRVNDDLIAIVMPNGRVHLEDMPGHLAKCYKCGRRQITELVNAIGLNSVG